MAPADSTRARRALRTAARLLVPAAGVGLGAVALRKVDLHLVLASMASLPRSTVLLVLAMSLGQAVAMATRLWAVFPHGARPGWARVARAFGFGQLANACLPGRAGDVVKVVALARDRGEPGAEPPVAQASAAGTTGVMLADKALDIAALGGVVLLFAPALLLGVLTGAAHAAWIAVAAAGALAGSIAVARRAWPGGMARARRFAAGAWRTLRQVLTPARLATGLALGVLAWMAEAGSMQVLSSALGLHLALGQTVVGLLVLNLGIAVPLSAANVGTYEAATVVGLAPFGVPAASALALGALHHAVQLLAIALFALFFWVRDRARRAAPAHPLL